MKYVDDSSLPQLSDKTSRLNAPRRARTPSASSSRGRGSRRRIRTTSLRHSESSCSMANVTSPYTWRACFCCLPVADGGDIAGVGIFDATAEDVERIMSDDPAVKAEILTYELHPRVASPLRIAPYRPRPPRGWGPQSTTRRL
jgi:hypothetical protein